MGDSQRTEQPTQQRLKKVRDQGDFPSAREFVSAAQLLIFVLGTAAWMPQWLRHAVDALRKGIRAAFSSGGGTEDVMGLLRLESAQLIMPLLGPAMLLVGGTLALQLVTTGFGVSLGRLTPQLNRLSPGQRLSQMPGNNLGQLAQAAIAIPLLVWIVWLMVRGDLERILHLPLLPVRSIVADAGDMLRDALRRSAVVLLAVGAVMLIRERSRYMARLRMTRSEVMDEARESQGNPHMKARARKMQRGMRSRNMMSEVPKATAVIVNPTHYAVAIRYEQGVMAAPLVVAKGRNFIAARIRARAAEHQIPIIENPPLAQALYKTVEIGQEVPPHLYRAVAEILAYIFKLAGRRV